MAKIVVVDDDLQIRGIVKEGLEQTGYEVVCAEDGIEGLAAARREHPDLILLDVMMPRMRGYEVLQRLKEDESLRDIPVIMVTVKNDPVDVARGLDTGATDYLAKPFALVELRARVRSCLRVRELERELVEKERRLASAETLRQTLVTLSHYVNNAIAGILGIAEACDGGEVSADELIRVCQSQTERISAVLRALDKMAKQTNIRTTVYAVGIEDRMFDIEEELRRTLGET